jgi:hypothetical protein
MLCKVIHGSSVPRLETLPEQKLVLSLWFIPASCLLIRHQDGWEIIPQTPAKA